MGHPQRWEMVTQSAPANTRTGRAGKESCPLFHAVIFLLLGPPLVQWTCCFSRQNSAELWQTIARSQHVLLPWLMVKRGHFPPYFMLSPPFWLSPTFRGIGSQTDRGTVFPRPVFAKIRHETECDNPPALSLWHGPSLVSIGGREHRPSRCREIALRLAVTHLGILGRIQV